MNAETETVEPPTTNAETEGVEMADQAGPVETGGLPTTDPNVKSHRPPEVAAFLPIGQLKNMVLAGQAVQRGSFVSGESEFVILDSRAVYDAQTGGYLRLADTVQVEAFKDALDEVDRKLLADEADLDEDDDEDEDDGFDVDEDEEEDPESELQEAQSLSAAASPPSEDDDDEEMLGPFVTDLDTVLIPSCLSEQDLEEHDLDTGPDVTYQEAYDITIAAAYAAVSEKGEAEESADLNEMLFLFGKEQHWPGPDALWRQMREMLDNPVTAGENFIDVDRDLRAWLSVFNAVGEAMCSEAFKSRSAYDRALAVVERSVQGRELRSRLAKQREKRLKKRKARPKLLQQEAARQAKVRKTQERKAARRAAKQERDQA
ncbi:MAG: hypothetical protein AAFY82_00195 [Pseudomonadota bacterium]